MSIQEIMSTPAVTCRPDDSLNVAAQLMWERDCGAIPVVDDDGHVVGMVTDRDVCMAAYTNGGSLHAIPVSSAMATDVFSCGPGDSLEAAERLMGDKQIRRVPIVDDDNCPIGVLSLNDIVRHVASSRKKDGLDRMVTQTMAAICVPRAQPPLGAVAQPAERAQPSAPA